MSEEGFARSQDYDRMLAQGLKLSGEDKGFFIAGRLAAMMRELPEGFAPSRVLDYGCGLGDTCAGLAALFPGAAVLGADASAAALEHARKTHAAPRVRFAAAEGLEGEAGFDLIYVNGVFHHIDPVDRDRAAARLGRLLAPGGRLAFFENNPWNPGTRWVMSRIPFDRGARPISAPVAARLLRAAGLRPAPARFLFYFPRPLARLRVLEPGLARLPLGAQYLILARKP